MSLSSSSSSVEETDNDESLFSGRGLDMKNVCNVPSGDEFVIVFTNTYLKF